MPNAPPKYIGNYLVEAGLLSTAQVDVILSDQVRTHMRFGEIVASRGWLKEQTIEYLMKHLIVPNQQSFQGDRSVDQPPSPALNPVVKRKIEPPLPHSVHDRETLVISMPLDEEIS
jgi:hypothetical protein